VQRHSCSRYKVGEVEELLVTVIVALDVVMPKGANRHRMTPSPTEETVNGRDGRFLNVKNVPDTAMELMVSGALARVGYGQSLLEDVVIGTSPKAIGWAPLSG